MNIIHLDTAIKELKSAGLWGDAVLTLSGDGTANYSEAATSSQKQAVEDIIEWAKGIGLPPDYATGLPFGSQKQYVYDKKTKAFVENYITARQARYPDVKEYLDGVVKASSSDATIKAEGEAQIAKYCADCLAVKAEIPKQNFITANTLT